MLLNRKLRARLKREWGQKPAERQMDEDLIEDVSLYWRSLAKNLPEYRQVDDITWNDLDMNQVFQRMNFTQSVVGSEALYAMLRDTGCEDAELSAREKMIRLFQTDEEARLEAQLALRYIGKSHFHGAIGYMFTPEKRYPAHGWLYYLLSLLPVVLIVAGLLNAVFFIPFMALVAINIFAYYRTSLTWQREINAVKHIASVLNCAQRLCHSRCTALEAVQQPIRELTRQLHGIRGWCTLLAAELPGELSILTDYLRIIFMLKLLSLCRIVGRLRNCNLQMQELYQWIGQIDACLALAALRTSNPGLCQPVFVADKVLDARDLTHPLVANAVANDCLWRRNALITGSNASGKSTFIKAVAINAILAQTVLTCYASSLRMCRARVMTSMAVRDNILAGESYFVAEIRSLKRILEAMSGAWTVFCFVDEILRGTNTVERIAASSSVLADLEDRHCLCMAATHDVELTRMLQSAYANWHFREQITPAGVAFTYRLCEGPASSRNAIALLEQMGFPPQVVQNAKSAIRRFEREGRWR